MVMKTVVVGCRLPNGLVIENPINVKATVTLAGPNKSNIIGATYGITEVDTEFWELWFAVNKDFPAITSGAIFSVKTHGDVAVAAMDLKDARMGFEPMRTDGEDPRASGVSI